jgi:dehydrogenase/reductase SDR family protein 12
MHPGWADTEGVRTSIPGFHAAFKDKLRSPQQGADTVLWLALADAGALSPGAFFLDRRAQPRDMAMAGTRYSAADAAQLYDSLLALAGLRELQGQGAAPGAPGPAADSGGGAARQQ